MKRTFYLIVCFLLGGIVTASIITSRLAARHHARLAEQQSAWEAEKTDLEAALAAARGQTRVIQVPAAPIATSGQPAKRSPAEIVAQLRGLKLSAGPGGSRVARHAIYLFEELIGAGPAALPAIRAFLVQNQDADFNFGAAFPMKNTPGGVPLEFVLPPSLRFGLFDAARQIGGEEGEKVLAETLSSTGRGVELAWLARALQETAPNKYRLAALSAAYELLGRPAATPSASLLDRNNREYLFSVLALYNDTSYATTAQTQLVRPDGQVDRSALKYLQQSLGPQSIAIAAQLYDDPRLADPAKKEPLARLALNFVGADPQANEFYQKAINDLNLPKDDRRNLIEDLNQDGFVDRKSLNASDLQLIQNRIQLIEQLAPGNTDPINAAAFAEAYKDLLKMREKYAQQLPNPAR